MFGFPVEGMDGIESVPIGAASPKQNDLIIVLIIGEGGVGSAGGHLPCGVDFPPFHLMNVEDPDIIHIDRFYVICKYIPA